MPKSGGCCEWLILSRFGDSCGWREIGTWRGWVVRRRFLQTLLVGAACEGALGLLPGRVAGNPGRRSLRLACPGLPYAALSGLKREREGGALTQAAALSSGALVLSARLWTCESAGGPAHSKTLRARVGAGLPVARLYPLVSLSLHRAKGFGYIVTAE